MILLDTCTLIFDALTPERLSDAACGALDRGEAAGTLACADITLWEIAMLVSKGRLAPVRTARASAGLHSTPEECGCCRSRRRSPARRRSSTCPRAIPLIG